MVRSGRDRERERDRRRSHSRSATPDRKRRRSRSKSRDRPSKSSKRKRSRSRERDSKRDRSRDRSRERDRERERDRDRDRDRDRKSDKRDDKRNGSGSKSSRKKSPEKEKERSKSNEKTLKNDSSEYDPGTVDKVPIGKGNAKIPLRVLQDINWRSHTTATRQLLQAVFPRNVLATHCLTGKQSPAFMNRPAKKILDPKLVEDIVKIVSTRCGVPKNLVRNSITIKCTDEAKLYRNRQHYKQQRKHIENDENSPPSALSSDESTNTLIN